MESVYRCDSDLAGQSVSRGDAPVAFVALLAPLALLLAGLAIKRNKINLAIVMVLPVVLFFSWLAMIVLQEPGSHN